MKILLLKVFLTVFTLVFYLNVIAQTQSLIPPSPNTKEFTKYIDQKVSLYNGIPEISIPLYNIQVKGLTIPISLSYHASGIRYGQIDGDVGVGWVLNPGYRISRSVHGYADETQAMPSNMISTLENLEANGEQIPREGYLSKFVPDAQMNLNFGPSYQGSLDGEFDQFTFSTPTAAGKFIITDRVNKLGTTLEESNILIDYIKGTSQCGELSNHSITGLRLIDDVGNKYFYGEYKPQTSCHIERAVGPYIGTGWAISEIVTPTDETIKFTYEQRPSWMGRTDHIRNFSVRETNQLNCFINTTAPESGLDIVQLGGYQTFYSKEITTPNEKIIFYYNDCTPQQLYPCRVKRIEVKALNGVLLKAIDFFYTSNARHIFLDYILLKDKNLTAVEKYSFDYHDKNISATTIFTADQYGYYLEDEGTTVPRFYHQEFLDDPILINSADATSCSVSLGSTMVSFLGGLTLPSKEALIVPDYFSLKKITYPTGGYSEYEYENGQYGVEGNVENAGIRIKKITSSDGSNPEALVRSYAYGNNQNGHLENGLGKYEVWFSPELFVNEKTEWLYGCFMSQVTGLPTYCNFFSQRLITYSSTVQGDLGDALSQSSFVTYPCVTEYQSKHVPSNGYSISDKSGGKTVYYFNLGDIFELHGIPYVSRPPQEYYPGSRTYVDKYSLWNTPRLERQVDFALEGTQYVPVRETILDYDAITRSVTGVKVQQSVFRKNAESVIGTDGYTFEGRFFEYGPYTIEIGKNRLNTKTEHHYLNGQTLTTTQTYEYSNHFPSKETMTNSTNATVVTYTTYPKDYAAGTGFITDMVTNNLVAYPIEQVKYVEEGANKKILAGQITTYKTGGKGLKESEFALENTAPIPLSSFKFSHRTVGQLPPWEGTASAFVADNNYKSRITYDSYDAKGNLLSATNDGGSSTSYIWGYNKTFPIAKIDNAKYDASGIDNSSGTTVYSRVNQVLFENFEEHPQKGMAATSHTGGYVYQGTYNVELRDKRVGSYLLTYWSSTNGTQWTKNETIVNVTSETLTLPIGGPSIILDDIRFHPTDAQMTTYTYDPLIGMTSQTDAAGVATYFEYDSYGRLFQVRDAKLNVLKQVKYHYKQ
jgi:YD repeat-containing protein